MSFGKELCYSLKHVVNEVITMQAKKRSLKTSTKTGKIDRSEIRTAIKALHVIPQSGAGWIVRKSGTERVAEQFANKEAAVKFGQSLAKLQKINVIIHGRDGKIQRINSSGSERISSTGSKHGSDRTSSRDQ